MEETQPRQLSRGALMDYLNGIQEQIKTTLTFLKPYEKRIPAIVAIISAEEKKEQNEQTKQNHKLYSQNLNSYSHEELNYLEQISKYLDNQQQIWLQLQEKIKKDDEITKKAYEQNGNIQDMERHEQIKQQFMKTIENQYIAQQNLPIDFRQKKKLDKIIKEKNKKHQQDEINKGKEIKLEGNKVESKNNLEDKEGKREIEQNKEEIELTKGKKVESKEEKENEEQQQKKEHFKVEKVREDNFLDEIELNNKIETSNQITQANNHELNSSKNIDVLSTSEEQKEQEIHNLIKTDSSKIEDSSVQNVQRNIYNDDQIQYLEQHPVIKDIFAKLKAHDEQLENLTNHQKIQVEINRKLEAHSEEQAEKIRNLEVDLKDQAFTIRQLKNQIKSLNVDFKISERKHSKYQNDNENICKSFSNLKKIFAKEKLRIKVLAKQVRQLKFKNIQTEKMILASSFVDIIYEKVSLKFYDMSWEQFKDKKLSTPRDEETNMLKFQEQAQKFIGITTEQWNVLREIKQARNLIFHHSENIILTAENKKLLLRYESEVNIALFNICFDFLDTIKMPKIQ